MKDPAGFGKLLLGSRQGVEINEKSVTTDVVTATNSSSTKQPKEVSFYSAGHSSSCNIPSTPVCSYTN